MKFMTFSASIFASIFSSIFEGKWFKKWSISSCSMLPFWLHFRNLFRRSTFECILVALWLLLSSLLTPFGSLLAPLGSLLAPFGSLLAPFGSPLAPFSLPFRSLWTPFSHFGWLWNPFGCIWLPFAYFFWFLTPSPNPSTKNREINTCIQPPADFRIHLSLQARGGYIAAGNWVNVFSNP